MCLFFLLALFRGNCFAVDCPEYVFVGITLLLILLRRDSHVLFEQSRECGNILKAQLVRRFRNLCVHPEKSGGGRYFDGDHVVLHRHVHVPLEEVTPLQRRNAKAVNFGIVYGISSFGLGQDLGISRKEAETYIRQYFETYPGIHEFLNRCVENAKEKGYSVTMFGRRRPVPELKSSNFMQRSFGERVAMNAPIQGTAADIIKIAMIRVAKRLKEEKLETKLILQVHDEPLLEVPEGELEMAEKILEEEMTGAAKLAVRLEIDMHTGKNWYEAK